MSVAHQDSLRAYLCELGEVPPVPGERFVDWGCRGCRAAWVAAVMNGIDPMDPERHLEHGRAVAQHIDDPHFSRAVALLGLRVGAIA